jgi:hypothetical protein
LMDIHSISEVNSPAIDLSKIEGPAHSTDFEPHAARGLGGNSAAGNPWNSDVAGKPDKKG